MQRKRCDNCRKFKLHVHVRCCPACDLEFRRCEDCHGVIGVFRSLMSHVRYYAFDKRVEMGLLGGRFHFDYWKQVAKRVEKIFGLQAAA